MRTCQSHVKLCAACGMLAGVCAFEEPREFDVLTQAYNALSVTAKVAKLGYQRVGFTNDDDGCRRCPCRWP
jgi:hypothetical protein